MEYPIKKISLNHPNYPDLLKQIYNPPKELYIQGKLKKQENLPLAIVGTRQASSFGKNLAKNFAYSLGKKGFTIISGLALGIDGAAHQGALLAGAKTIAVLGSGLKHIYPPSHKKLAKKILKKGGALISEYPPETGPKKQHFPARNRIIAGLSLGILVIEAPEHSGALITARFGAEEGREVMVVPFNISQKTAQGSNELIKKGAKVITCLDDILESFALNS